MAVLSQEAYSAPFFLLGSYTGSLPVWQEQNLDVQKIPLKKKSSINWSHLALGSPFLLMVEKM